jgi:AcrR family transcriptional regulator
VPSTTRRPSAGTDRRAAVEARILEATERLLAGGASFTELGVQRLAQEAGVARSTFYLHFSDKTALLLRLTGPLAGGAFELVEKAPPTAGLDAMTAAFGEVVAYYRARRHLLAAVLEVIAYDPVARAFWDEQLSRFVELGERWLRAEQQAGRTSATLDPATASRIFVFGGFQALGAQVLTGREDQDRVVVREIVLLQWYGGFRRPAGTEAG